MNDDVKIAALILFTVMVLFFMVILTGMTFMIGEERHVARDPLCEWAIAKVEHIEGVTDPLGESE